MSIHTEMSYRPTSEGFSASLEPGEGSSTKDRVACLSLSEFPAVRPSAARLPLTVEQKVVVEQPPPVHARQAHR